MDLYLISHKYYSFEPTAVTESQLLPTLANKKWQVLLEKTSWPQNEINEIQKYHLPRTAIYYFTHLQIVKCTNVVNPHWQITHFSRDLVAQSADQRIFSNCHVIKLILAAQKWLKEKKATEKWPGQMQYLSTSNKLGHPLRLPVDYVKVQIRRTQRHTPHNTTSYQHSRRGYCKSAFARSNYATINHYDVPKDVSLRHPNRNFRRKHLENFPWWDDNEYIRSHHSTGWKHSTKFKYQYLAHQKKHQDSSYYNKS